MRIGSVSSASFEQYKINRTQRSSTSKTPAGSDSVELSESSRLFSQAMQAARGVPEVRESSVNALRNEIEAGTYARSSREIAAKILSGTVEP